MQISKRTDVKNQMPEKEYRGLSGRLSSTDIRLYIDSYRKFYKQCILKEKDYTENTPSMILGSIADCELTCPELKDDKFYITTCTIPGETTQMYKLVQALYKRTLQSLDENGKQKEQFETLFTDAVNKVKYNGGITELLFKKKSVEKILELFTIPADDGSIGELYYKELLSGYGKMVVDMNMMTSGEKMAKDMRSSPYTGPVVNLKTEGDIEVFHQLVILFTYKDIEMRAMLDKTVINHADKTIQPYDIKVTYSNDEEGFPRMYLKGLYIQAATYDVALKQWKVEHGYEDYKVLPMAYPVGDSSGDSIPLMHYLREEDIRKAYIGFKLVDGHKWYMGFDEAVEDLKWRLGVGIWNQSREAYENQGELYSKLQYDV